MGLVVSIVVAVYNVEQYLDECIESIVGQTYEDLEIILIDDDSTDSSGRKCDEWEKRDNRIRVLHEKHSGLSAVRNKGLQKATGEYICFVDSDDTINENYVERMLEVSKEYNADLVLCDFYIDNTVDKRKLSSKGIVKIWDDSYNFMKDAYNNALLMTSCVKLARRKIYKDIIFPEGRMHEDSFTILQVAIKCNRIVKIFEELYFYRQRNDSIVHCIDDKLFEDNIYWIESHIMYYEENKLDMLNFEAKKLLLHDVLKSWKYLSFDMRCKVYSVYKKYYKDIIFCKYMSIKSRIKYLLLGNPILLKCRVHI